MNDGLKSIADGLLVPRGRSGCGGAQMSFDSRRDPVPRRIGVGLIASPSRNG